MTCAQLAVMAATLANGAVNPFTGERALPRDRVRDLLERHVHMRYVRRRRTVGIRGRRAGQERRQRRHPRRRPGQDGHRRLLARSGRLWQQRPRHRRLLRGRHAARRPHLRRRGRGRAAWPRQPDAASRVHDAADTRERHRRRHRRRDPPQGREHRRLAEHGELHLRLRGQRDDDARGLRKVLGDDHSSSSSTGRCRRSTRTPTPPSSRRPG